MYNAYITTLKNIRKHSNADRLQCVEVFGQNVVVGLEYKEGQRVVFFPVDGQLSLEFARENNLVRKKDFAGNNIGGYMDEKKRNIAAIKLRGERSEGLILPIECLEKYTDISELKDGDAISKFGDIEICRKYIPRGPRGRVHGSGGGKARTWNERGEKYLYFDEHIHTDQLAYNMSAFYPGDTIYLTRKLHGTSGRTMKTMVEKKENTWIRKELGLPEQTVQMPSVVSGSRKQVLHYINDGTAERSDEKLREKYHNLLKDIIPMGFEIFYEIVGYLEDGTPIMGYISNSKVKDREFSEKFGRESVFSYGCEEGQSEMYVYRMTVTTQDGIKIELPWESVKYWCGRMGLKYVPELEKFIFTTEEDLKARVHKYNEGMPVDELGQKHIAEGVVVRIDNRNKFTAFKDKVFEFKVLEGIIKENAEAPDMEEAEEIEDAV